MSKHIVDKERIAYTPVGNNYLLSGGLPKQKPIGNVGTTEFTVYKAS